MSKDYCKADNNIYCFFQTIFRLAIPAFFRFTDVTDFLIGGINIYIGCILYFCILFFTPSYNTLVVQ